VLARLTQLGLDFSKNGLDGMDKYFVANSDFDESLEKAL
jgi:hypothetical protein